MNLPGLDILNTGHGHMEVNFDKDDPIEIERARRIITDMIERGYNLFIEGKDGRMSRVLAFDPETDRYIIGDGAVHPASEPIDKHSLKQRVPRKQRKTAAAVPMREVRATAMGPSAGG